MSRLSVLVVSAGWTTAARLTARLDNAHFSVTAAHPGPGLIQAVRRRQPHLVILEGIDTRPDAAQLEVAVLKDQCPGVRIIALSADSTDADGGVVEQGVFCYLSGCSFHELLRVIEAAAHERQSADAHSFTSYQPRSAT